ncbi:MAG: hypothetical protein ACRC4L_03110 [Mycoplasma sp.]
MLKVNTDYINKFDKKKTLTIISRFKSKLMTLLENEYNLLEIDPEYVVDLKKIHSSNRPITFDNYFENSITELSPFINNQLISYVNEFDFPVKFGVMSYAAHFYRDFQYNLNQTWFEFILYGVWKEFLSEINEVKLIQHVEHLCNKINVISNLIDNTLNQLPKKILITSVDKLIKQYPLIPKDKLIKYANSQNELMLVFGVDGNNKKELSFIEEKTSVYGEFAATLYIFNKVSNETLKLLTIYVPPSKKQLLDKIKNNNLDQNNFNWILENLNDDANLIGLEIHFYQLMMFIMGKYSIHEVLKSPSNLDVSTKFKNNFIL